jgi:hypothetical protein
MRTSSSSWTRRPSWTPPHHHQQSRKLGCAQHDSPSSPDPSRRLSLVQSLEFTVGPLRHHLALARIQVELAEARSVSGVGRGIACCVAGHAWVLCARCLRAKVGRARATRGFAALVAVGAYTVRTGLLER